MPLVALWKRESILPAPPWENIPGPSTATGKMLQSPSTNQILEESIVFGAVGFVLFIGRLWSRAILRQSWKKLQIDDYSMVVTFCCYTTLLVLLNYSCHYATNEYPSQQRASIIANPKEVQDRIYGSKIVIGSNQAYLMTLWGVKACLLMLYYQMTRDTPNNFYVKVVVGYVVLGLLAVEVPYFFLLCRPFSQYWAIAPENQQCANYHNYCIIQMVFNVSSDFLMLLLPLPFIINARVPPLKRALLMGIFSLGAFVILAAVLNKYYNFTMPNTTVYMVWHIREASTSIFVANIMCWWPLLRKMFGWKRFLQRSSGNGTTSTMAGNMDASYGRQSLRSDAVTPEPYGRGTLLTPLKTNVKLVTRETVFPVTYSSSPWNHQDEKDRSVGLEVAQVGPYSIGKSSVGSAF